jgi:hypothetical protein
LTVPAAQTHRLDEFRAAKPSVLSMTAPRAKTIVCDAGGLPPHAGTVDALARLQLGARRCGVEIRLRDASTELQELIELVGLSDVLRVEPGRKPE